MILSVKTKKPMMFLQKDGEREYKEKKKKCKLAYSGTKLTVEMEPMNQIRSLTMGKWQLTGMSVPTSVYGYLPQAIQRQVFKIQ